MRRSGPGRSSSPTSPTRTPWSSSPRGRGRTGTRSSGSSGPTSGSGSYAPEKEGVILDIYLLPLHRRRGVGEFMLKETWELLKARGAGVITAEFPTQNEIAARFYAKRGFRPITALHARQV